MKRLIWLFAIILSFGLSSCIDLLDEITLNDDKSGSVFIGIESQLLGSMMSMAKEQVDPNTIESLEEFPNKSKDKLKDLKGISNVKSFNQISAGRIGISFEFANTKALNHAYYSLLDIEKTWYSPNIVKISKHKISRRNLTPQLVKELNESMPELKDSEYLKYFTLKSVVRLPAKSSSVTYGEGAELKNAKNISMRFSFSEILNKEYSTAYKIKF